MSTAGEFRTLPQPQVVAGDPFQSPPASASRHEGVRLTETSWGKSVRRAVVARGSKRRKTPGDPWFERDRPVPPCEGWSCRWRGRFASTFPPGSDVRWVCSWVYLIAEVDGRHVARSAPVKNRQGGAGLAGRREPIRERMSEAGPGCFRPVAPAAAPRFGAQAKTCEPEAHPRRSGKPGCARMRNLR